MKISQVAGYKIENPDELYAYVTVTEKEKPTEEPPSEEGTESGEGPEGSGMEPVDTETPDDGNGTPGPSESEEEPEEASGGNQE